MLPHECQGHLEPALEVGHPNHALHLRPETATQAILEAGVETPSDPPLHAVVLQLEQVILEAQQKVGQVPADLVIAEFGYFGTQCLFALDFADELSTVGQVELVSRVELGCDVGAIPELVAEGDLVLGLL